MDLLPAIDIVNGQAVRLLKGQAGTETGYGDPVEFANRFASAGARWLHMVDLDAAFGRGANTEVTLRIVQSVDINVELCGGIRDDEALARAYDAGARRVNIGTAALENPAWTAKAIKKYGDFIAVGLDVKGRTLAGRGWTKEGGCLFDVLKELDDAGCARYVVTDVAKDGTLSGPNTELLEEVCRATAAPVVASGGISTLDDLRAIRGLESLGVDGVIVGKALYSGRFTLAQALDVVEG